MKLPNRKITNYVEQQTNGELLIYNLSTNWAFCLNETSARVFSACDGKATFDELQRLSGFPADLIYFALDELAKQKLVENDYVSPFAETSRREIIRRIGLATMIALPLITGLTAPRAAQAASPGACVVAGGSPQGTVLYNCGTSRYGMCQAGCVGSPVARGTCCSNAAEIDPSTCPPGTDPDVRGCTCRCA